MAIDEFLVFRTHEKINILANYYRRIIDDRFHKDSSFAGNLKKWFRDQNWEFAHQYEDFAKIARQTAYLLANKILFYDLLQAKRPNQLDPLEIPESRTQSSMLKDELQAYFKKALDIDYETIYTTDFIDTIAFPDHHNYSQKDIENIEQSAIKTKADIIIITEKDAPKLAKIKAIPVLTLAIELRLLGSAETDLLRLISDRCSLIYV